MKKYAIIVAGGSGLRMGTQTPKQFLLLHGRTVLSHSLSVFLEAYEDMEIILVLPEEHMEVGKRIIYTTHSPHRIRMTRGGSNRWESVRNGLQLIREDFKHLPGALADDAGQMAEAAERVGDIRQIPEDAFGGMVKDAGMSDDAGKTAEGVAQMVGDAIIFVHDGVRCLLTAELVHRCYEQALESGTAIPVIDSKDSVRVVTETGNEAIERTRVKLVQTPQTFLSSILLPAYQLEYQERFTDEATVVEASGRMVHLVEGEINNIKITTPADLVIAEKLLGAGE